MLCSNWPKVRNLPPATPSCHSFAEQGFYVAPRLRALCVPVLYGEPGIFLSSSLVSFFSRVIFTVCAPLHHALSEARDRKSTRLNSSHTVDLVCRLLLEK